MEFAVKKLAPEGYSGACIIAAVYADGKLSDAAKRLDVVGDGQVVSLIKSGDLPGQVGQVVVLRAVQGIAAQRVLLIGCGPKGKLDARGFCKLIQRLTEALYKTGAREAISYLTEVPVQGRDLLWAASQTARGVLGGLYRFDILKSDKSDPPPALKKFVFAAGSADQAAALPQAIAQGEAIANGITLAKDLANLPGNHCTPTYLAEQAQALGKQHAALKVKVLNQADMEKLAMGSLLSVARGSRQAPKLISMEYRGAKDSGDPVVLIGKGITFDSGGISIKPSAAMDEMKFDMCGAASVMGTMAVVCELGLPIDVVGIIPSCENMPDGDASKPGDIVTSMSGQTIEVLNTDAEGRLILCDALTYAERYKPAVVIDIATLTGACVIALGKHASGMLSNDDGLADDLIAAGERSGDRAWRLPLWDEYQKQLDSNFADIANIGGREAGTITAACFLSRFAKEFPWAHLDIAGTAWLGGKSKGATGRPVPLLVDYLLART